LSEQVAIFDGSTGLSRTFHDYYVTMSGVAAALRYDMDVTEDSTVALFSPNHVDFLPVSLAVGQTGAKLAPVNPLYTAAELSSILKYSRTSVLIAHHSRIDVALDAIKQCGKDSVVKHVIVLTDHDFESIPHGTVSLSSLKSHDRQFHDTIHLVHENTETHPYLLPYSSGTTGMPKV
jgi:acyl-CoA synthetase (AMP-forming)/AMP-acid ligase II